MENPELENQSGLKVVKVSSEVIDELIWGNPDSLDIQTGDFAETDGQVKIKNYGADPCIIIYIHDLASGKIISGHFPEVLKERDEYFKRRDLSNMLHLYSKVENTDKRIILPGEEDVERLSYIDRDDSYEKYLEMKKIVSGLKTKSGYSNFEVFFFGQNNPAIGKTWNEYLPNLTDSVIEQHDVAFDFYQLDIPYYQQHDFRIPGVAKSDNTFYDPKTRIIYHNEEKP